MKTIIRLEEIAMFALALFAFVKTDYSWWVFPVLLLTPDVSMVGYLLNSRVGAVLYNVFHHKALAIGVYLIGIYFNLEWIQLAGIIFFAHSSIDRAFGYGLKYKEGFAQTHLGLIGNQKV